MKKEIFDELVCGILRILPEQTERIILYGSVARQSETADSDVDIAILLREKMTAEIEDRLSDFIVDMNLKYDKVFSVIDIDYDMFCKWVNVLPFYKNVEKEGITLWKAA